MHPDREEGSVSGAWTLHLAGRTPRSIAAIQVVQLSHGGTEPEWFTESQTLTFVWSDGRRQVWPWAHLLSADYEPPVRASRG